MRIISPELTVKIDAYREWLFNGDIKRIAKDTNRTPRFVGMVLTRRSFNPDVVQAVREKAIKNARALGVELQ